MAQYNPKSKYEIREASAGEFIFKSNRQPYIGPYIEVSSGKFYAGSDPKNLASEIVRPKPIPNNFGKTRDVAKYNVLNKSTYGKLKKVKNIVPVKNRRANSLLFAATKKSSPAYIDSNAVPGTPPEYKNISKYFSISENIHSSIERLDNFLQLHNRQFFYLN